MLLVLLVLLMTMKQLSLRWMLLLLLRLCCCRCCCCQLLFATCQQLRQCCKQLVLQSSQLQLLKSLTSNKISCTASATIKGDCRCTSRKQHTNKTANVMVPDCFSSLAGKCKQMQANASKCKQMQARRSSTHRAATLTKKQQCKSSKQFIPHSPVQ